MPQAATVRTIRRAKDSRNPIRGTTPASFEEEDKAHETTLEGSCPRGLSPIGLAAPGQGRKTRLSSWHARKGSYRSDGNEPLARKALLGRRVGARRTMLRADLIEQVRAT